MSSGESFKAESRSRRGKQQDAKCKDSTYTLADLKMEGPHEDCGLPLKAARWAK